MSRLRRITVRVPKEVLENAQACTGEGLTQTVTAGLNSLALMQAQQEALKLRDKVKFDPT